MFVRVFCIFWCPKQPKKRTTQILHFAIHIFNNIDYCVPCNCWKSTAVKNDADTATNVWMNPRIGPNTRWFRNQIWRRAHVQRRDHLSAHAFPLASNTEGLRHNNFETSYASHAKPMTCFVRNVRMLCTCLNLWISMYFRLIWPAVGSTCSCVVLCCQQNL